MPDTKKFYDILGVEKTASADEIRKAYKRKAVQMHPDKNRDDPSATDKFKELSQAYECLSDEEKRSIYDKYGEEGLSQSGAEFHDPTDLFSSFFGGGLFGGGGGRRGGPPREQKGEDVFHPLSLSLEELYNGTTKKLALQKRVLCSKCKGSGAKKEGKSSTCTVCKGSGVKISIRQFGPGMMQQTQSVCPTCHGEGTCISEKDKCASCKGQKVVQEKKVLTVHIDKGMRHNQKIPFAGEGDQAPNVIPGDIVIVVQEKPHDRFKREGHDLLMEQDISLKEALCGFSVPVKHLNNEEDRFLNVSFGPGRCIKPSQVKVVPNEGMPRHRSPFEKGNLYIKFNVKFPERLDEKVIDLLQQSLPDEPSIPTRDVPMEAEDVSLHDAEDFQKSNGGGRGREAYDDDEDEGRPRQGCVHQ